MNTSSFKIVLISFLLISQMCIAQNEKNLIDSLYWFHLKLEINRDSITRQPFYKVVQVFPEIITGNEKDFLRYQKEILEKNCLTIGPFHTKKDAGLSIEFYNNHKDSNHLKNISEGSEFYWYLVKIEKTKKTGAFEFSNSPCLIASGTMKDFTKVFNDGLSQLFFEIGPFTKQNDAETSKKLNYELCHGKPKHNRVTLDGWSIDKKKRYVNYSTFYWFSLKPEKYFDTLLRSNHYKFDSIQSGFSWGNIPEYLSEQKKQMRKGFILAGPFQTLESAQISSESCQKQNSNDSLCSQSCDEYFWYALSLKKSSFTGKLKFIRIPATVLMGTASVFSTMLKSRLKENEIVTGLFKTNIEAEESKRVNRMME